MPKAAEPWSLTSLREKLIKIGAKVVSHGRYMTFQMAEVAVPRQMFQAKQGRQLSTLAPLRDLRARASDPAWTRRAVDEGVKSCPRAQCGKSARCVRRNPDVDRPTARRRHQRDREMRSDATADEGTGTP